jgi:hypothetical protein
MRGEKLQYPTELPAPGALPRIGLGVNFDPSSSQLSSPLGMVNRHELCHFLHQAASTTAGLVLVVCASRYDQRQRLAKGSALRPNQKLSMDFVLSVCRIVVMRMH